MTKRTKRTILFSILAVMLTGVCVGYYLWNKPHKDVKHADAITVTAVELYNIFNTDSGKAKSLYTDKVLDVKGEVMQLTVNRQGQQVILLRTAVADAAVNCTMEENANNIKQGDRVNIKGICSGYIAGDTSMDLPGDVFILRSYHQNDKQ